MPPEKSERLQVRLTPEESTSLACIAAADGMTKSEALRLMIRREARARARADPDEPWENVALRLLMKTAAGAGTTTPPLGDQ